MRWGIRRYQNKDGTLTELGKQRLQIDAYEREHDSDILLKKGTKASRVVSTNRYCEYRDPELGGSAKAAKQYVKDRLSEDEKLETKYFSIDNVRNSGRHNGKDFYVDWFTDGGWAPNDAQITMYELKKDVRVASGKKVMNALLEEVGSESVTKLLKENRSKNVLTLDYTTNKELFNRVNKRLIDEGYDAVEDINDSLSDMPIIMFNSSKNMGKAVSVQSGKVAVNALFKKYNVS
jgi:hypothetical protein